MDFGEKIVNFTGVKQPLVWIMENACLEGMILDKLSMNVNALLHFGEIDVNFTNVKQPLVWIMENVCKEQIILDKLSMNVNAFLELREMFVNTYQAINKKFLQIFVTNFEVKMMVKAPVQLVKF